MRHWEVLTWPPVLPDHQRNLTEESSEMLGDATQAEETSSPSLQAFIVLKIQPLCWRMCTVNLFPDLSRDPNLFTSPEAATGMTRQFSCLLHMYPTGRLGYRIVFFIYFQRSKRWIPCQHLRFQSIFPHVMASELMASTSQPSPSVSLWQCGCSAFSVAVHKEILET